MAVIANPTDLLAYLQPDPYQFALRGWKAPAVDFFRPTAEHSEILGERARWLHATPARCLLYRPEADALVRETAGLAAAWGDLGIEPGETPGRLLNRLGHTWEADILLLNQSAAGRFALQGGAICFPSSWAPDERLGQAMDRLHAPVPGLNQAIGANIDALLERLPPGKAWLRVNWGISSSPERNQHPSLQRNVIAADSDPSKLWLRIEYQALVRLEASRGILFGIRLNSFALPGLRGAPPGQALAVQLRSLPPAMRAYKHITGVADRLADYLSGQDQGMAA